MAETRTQQEQLPTPRGIQGIRNILVHESSETPTQTVFMTDLDDTIKEAKKHPWPDGKERRILPQTVAALAALHAKGIQIGVVTEQSFSEIAPFLTEAAQLALGEQASAYDLFNGPMIGEGGSVARRGKGPKQGELVTIAPPKARADREKLFTWLTNHVTPDANHPGWNILEGTDPETATWVQLPSEEDQGTATLSLWEQGPHISDDSSFEERYGHVVKRVTDALTELDIESLRVYEAGNGTVRIVPKNIDKKRTMTLLASLGAFDLTNMAYACDGPNDVAYAQALRKAGGGVIAVGNAVPEIKAVADYQAEGAAGLGFAETIEQIFPEEYFQSMVDLKTRGLN